MDDSSMNESLMAIMPTSGLRNQQGLPRRVWEESIISSETRKKACRSSVNHPRHAEWKYSSSDKERSRRIWVVSTTDMPRLHFPPMVLNLSDWVGQDQISQEGEAGREREDSHLQTI